MATTSTRYAPARAGRRPPSAGTTALVAAGFGGLTLAIRLAMYSRSFDLFGDEVIYADLGRSVIAGGFPQYQGNIFFLHGPLFFYLEAAWAHLLGSSPTLIGRIDQMRALNAVFAAGTAVVVVLLGVRAGSLRAGAVAGLLFALDPFCIMQNDRVFLETSLMFWALLGYLVFLRLPAAPPTRSAWLRAVLAGLLFGCAIHTKDEGALLTVLPLLAAGALGWGPRRSLTFAAAGTAVATYLAYLVVVAANGYFSAFWQAKTSGIQRMLGLIQVTGFHSGSGPSLQSRLLAEASYFGTVYLVLILAVPALVIVLLRGHPAQRMLGLVYCAAAVTLGYAVVLGTLEEQELYLLAVPSVLIIPLAATVLRGWLGVPRRWLVAATGLVLTVIVAVNVVTGVRWITHPDNGFARLAAYLTAHVPPGTSISDAAIGPSGDVGTNVLDDLGYRVGYWVTPAARAQQQVRYVLVPWSEVDEGYSFLSASQVRQLVGPGRLVFSFRGLSYGDLALYELPPAP